MKSDDRKSQRWSPGRLCRYKTCIFLQNLNLYASKELWKCWYLPDWFMNCCLPYYCDIFAEYLCRSRSLNQSTTVQNKWKRSAFIYLTRVLLRRNQFFLALVHLTLQSVAFLPTSFFFSYKVLQWNLPLPDQRSKTPLLGPHLVAGFHIFCATVTNSLRCFAYLSQMCFQFESLCKSFLLLRSHSLWNE